jgi:hypothetical protein
VTWALWVPGRFSLTNAMLDHLRAAGFYQGRSRSGKRLRAGAWDAFAAETQTIRLAVKAAAVRARVSGIRARADVHLVVLGHHKHDPDAWYLLGKAAVDGLVDAGALTSDRRNVGIVSGFVAPDPDHAFLALSEVVTGMLEEAGAPPTWATPGVVVVVREPLAWGQR